MTKTGARLSLQDEGNKGYDVELLRRGIKPDAPGIPLFCNSSYLNELRDDLLAALMTLTTLHPFIESGFVRSARISMSYWSGGPARSTAVKRSIP